MYQENYPRTHISHPANSPWIGYILEIHVEDRKNGNLKIQITVQKSPDIFLTFVSEMTRICTWISSAIL